MLHTINELAGWACLMGACVVACALGFLLGRVVAYGEVARALETGDFEQIITLIRRLEE